MACSEPIGSATTAECEQAIVTYSDAACAGSTHVVQLPYDEASCKEDGGSWSTIFKRCHQNTAKSLSGCSSAGTPKSYKTANGINQCVPGNPCATAEKMQGSAAVIQTIDNLWSSHTASLGSKERNALLPPPLPPSSFKSNPAVPQPAWVISTPKEITGEYIPPVTSSQIIGIFIILILLIAAISVFKKHHASGRGVRMGIGGQPAQGVVTGSKVEINLNQGSPKV